MSLPNAALPRLETCLKPAGKISLDPELSSGTPLCKSVTPGADPPELRSMVKASEMTNLSAAYYVSFDITSQLEFQL